MIKLPFPPSANALYVTRKQPKSGKKLRGRVKTKQYQAWCDEAGLSLRFTPKHPKAPFHLRIILHRPDKRARDASNLIKAPEDLLVAFQIIPDDSLAKSVHVEWSDREPSRDAWIEVEVTPA